MPMITVVPTESLARHTKRTVDFILAVTGLITVLLLLVLVAAAIKLDSRGPIFCREILHGYGKCPIRALKFDRQKVT